MAQEAHGAFYDLLAVRGVSRRDFLKYCSYVAASLGLAETAAPQIAAAVEKGSKLKPALWLNGGSCTGCTSCSSWWMPRCGCAAWMACRSRMRR